jgi:hypothetical protein
LAKIAQNRQKSPKIGKNRRKSAKRPHNIDPRLKALLTVRGAAVVLTVSVLTTSPKRVGLSTEAKSFYPSVVIKSHGRHPATANTDNPP